MKETYEYLRENIILVGLSGAAGSGKDYVAKKCFVERRNFKNFSFAWHFKVEAETQGLGSHEEIFHTKPPHIRNVLQIMGTELGRKRYGEHWWTDMTLNWIRLLHEEWGRNSNRWIIPDVRFPNELEAIQKCGGRVYRVVSNIKGRSLSEKAKQHPSETSLTDDSELFNGIIENEIGGDPEILQDIVDNIFMDIVQEKDWQDE